MDKKDFDYNISFITTIVIAVVFFIAVAWYLNETMKNKEVEAQRKAIDDRWYGKNKTVEIYVNDTVQPNATYSDGKYIYGVYD